ncbi:DUF6682 family protein [Halomonas sp. BN3-1]|uniref:phage adaptor protein n=1 Tax=Halomonas sp. BN3-1 TaxID=2082393 RepID=UPI000D375931|nr:DUF6682 family protein [Halomonas sp. BN3-1]
MASSVGTVIARAKAILQERGTGIRWTDSELIDWLNEAYTAIAVERPDAHSEIVTHELVEGARQQLPASALRLMDVISNPRGRAVRNIDRDGLDRLRPTWRSERPTEDIELFMEDVRKPDVFWVYPPAEGGVEIDMLVVQSPGAHTTDDLSAISTDPLLVSERYATALVDYVLYRAFAKDAEGQANSARSGSHYQAFMNAVQGKGRGDVLVTPESEQNANG